MRFLISLTALAALTACANSPAPAAPLDASNLYISISRWGVMLSEVAGLVADHEGHATTTGEPGEPRALARSLRETVWTYNLQRSELCAKNDLPELSCGPAYAPAWLTDEPNTAPSLAELDRRSEAVGNVVMPFWDGVCARERAKVPADEQLAVCPME